MQCFSAHFLRAILGMVTAHSHQSFQSFVRPLVVIAALLCVTNSIAVFITRTSHTQHSALATRATMTTRTHHKHHAVYTCLLFHALTIDTAVRKKHAREHTFFHLATSHSLLSLFTSICRSFDSASFSLNRVQPINALCGYCAVRRKNRA